MKRERHENQSHSIDKFKRSRALTPLRPFARSNYDFISGDKEHFKSLTSHGMAHIASTATAHNSINNSSDLPAFLWEKLATRKDNEEQVLLRCFRCELEGCGFSSSLLKEIMLFSSFSTPSSLSSVAASQKVHKHFVPISNVVIPKDDKKGVILVWPASKAPRREEDPRCIDLKWKKAWVFQLLVVMQWFHSRNLQYSNLILPHELLFGNYIPALAHYLEDCEFVSPCLLSMLYQFVLRIGHQQRRKGGYWPYTSPEALLGCEKHTPAMDMWAVGCFLFELLDSEPLFKPEDTHTEFAQLIEIYKVMGSPNEDTWPGVSRLPNYNSALPKWTQSQLAKRLEVHSEVSGNLLRNLLFLDPQKRFSVEQAIAHPFFEDIRSIIYSISSNSGNMSVSVSASDEKDLCKIDMKDISNILLRNEPQTHERSSGIGFFQSQKEISPEMRAILVDWLADVAWEFQLSDDALFMAIMMVDRVLQHQYISKRRFQLLGEACILLASKVVDVAQLTLAVLAYISDDIYTQSMVQEMELEVLESLDFDLCLLNPLYFVRMYVAVLCCDSTAVFLAQYLAGSFLQDPSHRYFSCSCIGAAAVALALGRVSDSPLPALLLPLLSEGCMKDFEECRGKVYTFWAQGMSPPPKIKKLKSMQILYAKTFYGCVSNIKPGQPVRVPAATRLDPSVLLTDVRLHICTWLHYNQLCAIARVSREWQQLSIRAQELVCELELYKWREQLDDTALCALARNSGRVKYLGLFLCQMSRSTLQTLLLHCDSLRELDLSYAVVRESIPSAEALDHNRTRSRRSPRDRYSGYGSDGLERRRRIRQQRLDRSPTTNSFLLSANESKSSNSNSSSSSRNRSSRSRSRSRERRPIAHSPSVTLLSSSSTSNIASLPSVLSLSPSINLYPVSSPLASPCSSSSSSGSSSLLSPSLPSSLLPFSPASSLPPSLSTTPPSSISFALSSSSSSPPPPPLSSSVSSSFPATLDSLTFEMLSSSSFPSSSSSCVDTLSTTQATTAAPPIISPPKSTKRKSREGSSFPFNLMGEMENKEQVSSSSCFPSTPSSSSSCAAAASLSASHARATCSLSESSAGLTINVPPPTPPPSSSSSLASLSSFWVVNHSAAVANNNTVASENHHHNNNNATNTALTFKIDTTNSSSNNNNSNNDNNNNNDTVATTTATTTTTTTTTMQETDHDVLYIDEATPLRFPPSLTSINLRSSGFCSVVDMSSLLQRCTKLKILNLGMTRVTPETVVEIANSVCAGELEEIHLNNLALLTNEAVKVLATNCRSLRIIRLDMCEAIHDEGVEAIAKSCPNLQVLGLCSNYITDRSLFALAEHSHALSTLELSFCRNLTSAGLQLIGEKCPMLTSLNLCLVDRLTDAAVCAIAENCQLREINLRACPQITDLTVRALSTHCQGLVMVHLLDCPHVTQEAISQLKNACPHANIVSN